MIQCLVHCSFGEYDANKSFSGVERTLMWFGTLYNYYHQISVKLTRFTKKVIET